MVMTDELATSAEHFTLGGEALNLRALVWSLSLPFIPSNAFPNLVDLNITQSGDVLNLDRLLRLLPLLSWSRDLHLESKLIQSRD